MKTSLFAGIVSESQLDIDPNAVEHALQFPNQPQRTLSHQDNLYAIAQWTQGNQSAQDTKNPTTFFLRKNRYVVLAWSRLDNRPEIALKLGIAPYKLSSLSDVDIILESYLRFGSECAKHLVGDFAFVIYDTLDKTLYCARDPIGVKPLFYAQQEKSLIFASNISFFHKLPFFKAQIDESRLVQYLLHIPLSLTETFYNNIQKLAPGHFLIYRNHKIQITRYHAFDPYKILHLKDTHEYIQVYQKALKEAVRCRIPENKPIGAEFSGGLDSTSIIGTALECNPELRQTLHTFAHDKMDLDGPCIDEALTYFNLQGPHHRFYNDVLFGQHYENMPETVSLLGYPEELGMGSFHIPFYKQAEKEGVQILLSGFGGDEFVTQRTQIVIIELLSKWQFKKAWRALHGKPIKRSLHLLKQLALLCYYQLAHKRCNHKIYLKALKERLVHAPLLLHWKQNLQLRKKYFALAQREGYTHVNEQCLEKTFGPIAIARLEECSILAAAYNIEYAWPLLDIRLIELFLSVPAEYKWHQGITRYLHREAMKEKIPESIRAQPTKEMGNIKPFPSISSSTQANRLFSEPQHPLTQKIVNIKKLQKLHNEHKNDTCLKGEKSFVYRTFINRSIQIKLLLSMMKNSKNLT